MQEAWMHLPFLAGYPSSFGSLATPAGSNVIAAAVSWLQAALLGTVATTIAVIAVSWIGFMMLAGRVPVQRGLTVIGGCFLLFGAPFIAAGIQAFVGGAGVPMTRAPAQLTGPPPAPPRQPLPRADQDPYAGASVSR
jgi:type IV secretory pathway VirB2 component (pilin)